MNNDYLFVHILFRRFVKSSHRHVVMSSLRQVVTSTFRHFDGVLFLASSWPHLGFDCRLTVGSPSGI